MYGHHLWQSIFQPGKVANPANNINITIDINSSQLNGEKKSPCPRSRLRIWPRETGSAVPSRVSLLILHFQAESGAYSRDSSGFPRRRPLSRSSTCSSLYHPCVCSLMFGPDGDAVAIGIPVGLSR